MTNNTLVVTTKMQLEIPWQHGIRRDCRAQFTAATYNNIITVKLLVQLYFVAQ